MKRTALGALLVAVAAACGEDRVTQPEPPMDQRVQYAISSRVEVDDSIGVAASDTLGLTLVGWEARLYDGTLLRGDSSFLNGEQYFSRRYELDFETGARQLPLPIRITAFAVNSLGGRVG